MDGSEILYNSREQNDFEKIHLSYLKNMLGVRRQTPTLVIYGDTGHFPLLLKQQVQTLKYRARLIALPDYHILKKHVQLSPRTRQYRNSKLDYACKNITF